MPKSEIIFIFRLFFIRFLNRLRGAAMLNEELLKKIRYIELNVKKKVDSYFQGSYHTLFKGHGLEFQEVREYTENDDARLIDWNVTARTGKPFVKLYQEERELTVMVLADISGSSIYGQNDGIRDAMTTIAAALTFSAIKNSDKVGLLLFSDKIEEYIPPRKGKNHLLTVIRSLLTAEPAGRGTDPDAAFKFLNKVMKRKALVFFLSDMLFDKMPESVKPALLKHEIISVGLIDEMLFSPFVDGALRTLDPENGIVETLDFSQASSIGIDRFIAEKKDSLDRLGISSMWIRNRENYMDDLVNEFRKLNRTKKR